MPKARDKILARSQAHYREAGELRAALTQPGTRECLQHPASVSADEPLEGWMHALAESDDLE